MTKELNILNSKYLQNNEHIKFQIFAEYLVVTMRETWGPEELLAEEEPWNSQAQDI